MRTRSAGVAKLSMPRTAEQSPCIGTVVAASPESLPLVEIGGGASLRARSLVPTGLLAVGAEVLVLFEQNDESRPIILGLLHDAAAPSSGFSLPPGVLDQMFVDRRKLVFNAQDEIILRCGKASVTLQADGAIIIRGTHVVSRSSGCNKIKGASVQIN